MEKGKTEVNKIRTSNSIPEFYTNAIIIFQQTAITTTNETITVETKRGGDSVNTRWGLEIKP